MQILFAILVIIIASAVGNDLSYRRWETADYVLLYINFALFSLLILIAIVGSIYEYFKKRT